MFKRKLSDDALRVQALNASLSLGARNGVDVVRDATRFLAFLQGAPGAPGGADR